MRLMMYYIKREKVARIIFDQRKFDKDSSHITIDISEKPLSRRMACLSTKAFFLFTFGTFLTSFFNIVLLLSV